MNLRGRTTAVMAELCVTIAKETIIELAEGLNKLPLNDTNKATTLLTIEQMMLGATLDGLFTGESPAEKLKKKLEFLDVIKRCWIQEAEEEKKGKGT